MTSSTPTRSSLLNIKGIAVLVALLAIVDVIVAYALSPLLTNVAVSAINRYTNARVAIDRVRLHPALLTVTAKAIEAADPDNPSRRMFAADSLRATLDPVALVSGKVFLGHLSFRQVELVLVKDAQGEFNVEKFLKKKEEAKPSGWTAGVKDWIQQRTGKKDWFGDAYDKAKEWVRRPQEKKEKAPKTLEVTEEPKGRIVDFSSPEDTVYRIGSVQIDNGKLVLSDKAGTLPPIEDLRFHLEKFVVRRSGAVDFAGIGASGKLRTAKEGRFDLDLDRSAGKIRARVLTENLDLAPLKPLYEESSPVTFSRGYLTLDCQTELTAAAIDSHNELKLEDYEMSATTNAKVGPVPASVIVDALNRRNQLSLKFNIGGDPDHPSTKGFETTLWDLVKDDLGSQALDTLQEKAGVKLGELSEKLKKLF